MADDLDKVFEVMTGKCELLRIGQTREECCREKGIADCPPLVKSEEHLAYSFVFLCAAVLILIIFVCVAAWLRWPQRVWNRFGETAKACVSGWTIWIVLIISYILIMQPYRRSMSPSDGLNLLMWLTLPPLSALAVYLWVKRFIIRK